MSKLADNVAVSQLSRERLEFLTDVLRNAGSRKRGLELLQEGRRRYPGDFCLNFELAIAYTNCVPPRFDEAVPPPEPLRPDRDHHSNLLGALAEHGKLTEAEALYREGIRVQPDSATLLNGLIPILRKQKKLPEAEALRREALKTSRPNDVTAHIYLGMGISDQGKQTEAEGVLCEAIPAQTRRCLGP